jgi:NDP-hexose-3-ketoreductase
MPALSPLGIACLGWSSIARRRFLPALQESGCARLVAIGSRDPAAACARMPAGCDAPVTTYEGLLARADVDLVYVSLPNHLHEEWSCRALAAGKHVLCEKPLAPSLEAVERMLAVAQSAGRLLFEAVMFRHHPQHAIVQDLLAAGRIGRLQLLRTGFGFPQDRPDDFRRDPTRGGGVCNDLLAYVAGAAGLFLSGPLSEVTGLARWRGGVDVAAAATGCNADGQLFSFTIGFEQAYECYYELVGDRGTLRLERAYTTPPELANPLHVTTAAGDEVIPLPPANHFVEMIRSVCARLRAKDGFAEIQARIRHEHQQQDLIRRGLRRREHPS